MRYSSWWIWCSNNDDDERWWLWWWWLLRLNLRTTQTLAKSLSLSRNKRRHCLTREQANNGLSLSLRLWFVYVFIAPSSIHHNIQVLSLCLSAIILAESSVCDFAVGRDVRSVSAFPSNFNVNRRGKKNLKEFIVVVATAALNQGMWPPIQIIC